MERKRLGPLLRKWRRERDKNLHWDNEEGKEDEEEGIKEPHWNKEEGKNDIETCTKMKKKVKMKLGSGLGLGKEEGRNWNLH